MHPVLLHVGPLTLRWYGVMMGLALFFSIPITARFGERFGIRRTLIVDALAFPFLATVLIGARLGYVASHPQEFLGDPLAIIRPPYAGLASHGAIALGPEPRFTISWRTSARAAVAWARDLARACAAGFAE